MNWWQRLSRRRKMEEELDREVQFHVEQHAADLMAQGIDPEDARRQARLLIGGPEQVKESCRDARGTRWLEELLQDSRYAARVLRQNPGFAAVSVLTLALGIGATTTIFSAANPILFEPLPYPHAERIATISYKSADGSRNPLAFGTYRELSARSRLFDGFAVFKPWQPTLPGPAEPERLNGYRVTSAYFRALGVLPVLGHDFNPADDRRGGSNVVILSNAVWQRRFHGDQAIVGQAITLDDSLYTVVGVMPATFQNVLAPTTDIWSLLQYDASLPANGPEWGQHLGMVARLREGMAMEQGKRELEEIAGRPIPEFSRPAWCSMDHGLIVDPLRDDVTRGVKPALLALIGAVILLLAIASVNVINLVLARGAQRHSEFAMRTALGAGRTRLVRQLLVESLLLAMMGGALGMALTGMGVRALVALSPPDMPRLSAIQVNMPVFLFGFGVTILIGLAVGLTPILHVSNSGLHAGPEQGSRRSTGGQQLTRRALVVIEVALALLLLVGAGLLLRSIERLFAVAPGFNPSHVLAMQVQVSSARRFPDSASIHRFYAQALDAVSRVPGVERAAFTSQLPLNADPVEVYGARFENDSNPDDRSAAFRSAVTPGYFELMGIPLIRGRLFGQGDREPGAVRPVLINQSFARRKFPGRDPIGMRVRFGGPDNRPWDVIVGVVGDVNQMSLAAGQADTLYVTTAQWLWADNLLWLVVRSHGDAAALAAAVRQAVWSVDRDQPIVRVATMESIVTASAEQRRFALTLFEAFAVAALLLAGIGIFGVLSGSVTERTREFGVRSALGAFRGQILALVVEGMTLTGLGAALGLGGAVFATRILVSLLFGVPRLDPITYLGVGALLGGVSAVASLIPAWRAMRVDPAVALRAE